MKKIELAKKIHLLCKKLGTPKQDINLCASNLISSNIVSIQNCGKEIASHLEMPNLTFVISYVKQKENVGGHIQLDNSSEVFIEIDADFKNDPEMVLSILSHEICHKYLQKHSIKLSPVLENEILTDLTTVYTGLGKLSLNGCEKTMVTIHDLGNNKTQTTRQKKRTGYVSRDDFAFAYALVSRLKKNPDNSTLKDLDPDARAMVQHHLNGEDLKLAMLTSEKLTVSINTLQNELVLSTHKSLADLDLNLRYLKNVFFNLLTKQVKEYHNSLLEFNELSKKVSELSNSEDGILLIETYLMNNDIEKMHTKLKGEHERINELKSAIGSMLLSDKLLIENLNLGSFSNTALNIFECPVCSNKMKIQENKVAKVNCSNCGYKFIVNTGVKRKDAKGILGKIKSTFSKFRK